MSANDSQNERRQHNAESDIPESEKAHEQDELPPLAAILKAAPENESYATAPLRSRRDLVGLRNSFVRCWGLPPKPGPLRGTAWTREGRQLHCPASCSDCQHLKPRRLFAAAGADRKFSRGAFGDGAATKSRCNRRLELTGVNFGFGASSMALPLSCGRALGVRPVCAAGPRRAVRC